MVGRETMNRRENLEAGALAHKIAMTLHAILVWCRRQNNLPLVLEVTAYALRRRLNRMLAEVGGAGMAGLAGLVRNR